MSVKDELFRHWHQSLTSKLVTTTQSSSRYKEAGYASERLRLKYCVFNRPDINFGFIISTLTEHIGT